MSADDALDVARFCWPEHEWHRPFVFPSTKPLRRVPALWSAHFEPGNRDHIAAAERVLVERGLGFTYGVKLLEELGIADAMWPEEAAATIRTAPLEVCLRALARVVREKQPKETKT